MGKFFLFFLFFIVEINASSLDVLEKIADEQTSLVEKRELIIKEHKQRYHLQLEAIGANLNVANESIRTKLLYYYKESENQDSVLGAIK